MIICAACGKILTPETNNESCPDTLYWHGKHSAVVMPTLSPNGFYGKGLAALLEQKND